MTHRMSQKEEAKDDPEFVDSGQGGVEEMKQESSQDSQQIKHEILELFFAMALYAMDANRFINNSRNLSIKKESLMELSDDYASVESGPYFYQQKRAVSMAILHIYEA